MQVDRGKKKIVTVRSYSISIRNYNSIATLIIFIETHIFPKTSTFYRLFRFSLPVRTLQKEVSERIHLISQRYCAPNTLSGSGMQIGYRVH